MKKLLKALVRLICRSEDVDGIEFIFLHRKYINFTKTIWFNYKILPRTKACHLPILIGKGVRLYDIGKINYTGECSTAKVSLGVTRNVMDTTSEPLVLYNKGVFSFGGNVNIHPGAKIVIYPGAEISIGNYVVIGSCSKVVSLKKITIGSNSGCSWNSQIFDTDFHFLYDTETKTPLKRTVPVSIGNNVFIGNHCNIGKGTKIPDGCTIASWSKVLGSFKKKGNNLLISNQPAEVILTGYTMTHSKDHELEEFFAKKIENH